VEITLYGAEWCAFCKVEKEWFASKGVEFKYIDIEKDEGAMQKLEELQPGRTSVPVTTFQEGERIDIVNGFNRPALQKFIKD
jgi:glutaredoxin